MSEPAVFCLIRDGQSSFYGDRWAGAFLYREILWGPEDFEAWVTQLAELDEEEWEGDGCGAVVADFDRRKLVWLAEADWLQVPSVLDLYEQLLRASWAGFEVSFAVEGMKAEKPKESHRGFGRLIPYVLRHKGRAILGLTLVPAYTGVQLLIPGVWGRALDRLEALVEKGLPA